MLNPDDPKECACDPNAAGGLLNRDRHTFGNQSRRRYQPTARTAPLRSGSPLVTKSNGSGKSGECESPPRLGERYEVVFADTLQNQKSRPSVAPVGDKVRTTGSNRIGLAPRESRFWGPGTLGAGIFRVSKFEFERNHTAPRTRSVRLYRAAVLSGIILQLPPGSIE